MDIMLKHMWYDRVVSEVLDMWEIYLMSKYHKSNKKYGTRGGCYSALHYQERAVVDGWQTYNYLKFPTNYRVFH